MPDLNLNIKLSYLYRDAGNYKQFGDIVFNNPENFTLDEINAKLKSLLIDGEYFVATQWQIPTLYTFPFDEELDHTWHEFESLTSTREKATDERSISEFINHLCQQA